MQSFSKQVYKHKRILYDLFVTIENIITGNSFITRSFKDGCNKYEIRTRSNQPTVPLANEETISEKVIVRKNNSSVEVKGKDSPQAELETSKEQTSNININITNPEIFKQYSVALISKLELNHRRIIYDLFVTIENIITAASSITREVVDRIITFKITPIQHQFKILILYELPSLSVNNNAMLQLIGEQEKHICENIPYLWKTTCIGSHFPNMNVTALEVTTQQEEKDLLNLNSFEPDPNEVDKNIHCVKSPSQELINNISSDYEEAESDFTGNKLCFKKLCDIKAGPSTFEKEKNLNDVKTMDSNDKTGRETIASSKQKINGNQLEKFHSGKKISKNYSKAFPDLSIKVIHKRMDRGEKLYRCQYCERTFSRSDHKKSHERTHTGEKPYKCDYCEKSFTQLPSKIQHERRHTGERPYKCVYCEKSFAQLSAKKIHERQHKGEKPYKCEYCEKTFHDFSSKKRHERQHTGEKPFKCGHCEKTFANISCRKSHERQHTGEKPYKCEYCEKTFAHFISMKQHERQHTGEKPYKCEYCEKIFADANSKKYHERQHTGEKPYKCGYCKKTFTNSSSKKRHERQHSGEKPYKCEYCEKTYAHASSKKVHERQHTGEEPYKCEYCEKTFAHFISMKRHERKHTGEKPYKCDYCEKTFAQFDSMKRHERLHTREKPL